MKTSSKTKKGLIQDIETLQNKIFDLEQKSLELQKHGQMLSDLDKNLIASFDASGVGIAVVLADGLLFYVNKASADMLGYSIEELKKKTFAEIPHPDDVEDSINRFQRSMVEGGSYIFEKKYLAKSGETRYAVTSATPIFNKDGSFKYAIVHVNNITDQKNSELALKESEERFRGLVNEINSGVAVYKVINDGMSGADYIIKEFNRYACEHENMKKEDVLGKSLKDIRPNIDEYGLIDVFRGVWETGEPSFFPAKIYVDEKYSNYYENRVFRLPSGEIVAIYDDVTDKEMALLAVQESNNRFNSAMKAVNDGLFDWNLETNEIFYSPQWKGLVGYKEDELPNEFSVWEKLTDPKDVKKSFKMLQDCIDGKIGKFEMEFKMKHKKGHWVNILSRAEVVKNAEGKAVQMIGTHVDISDRKKAEKALKDSEKEKSLMLKSMTNAFVIFESVFDGSGTFVSYRFVFINDAYERITGVKNNEVKGKTIHEVWPGTEPEWIKKYGEVVVSGVPQTFELYHAPTKKTYYCNVYRPFENQDKFCVILEDITEKDLAKVELETYKENLEEMVKEKTKELETKNKELERFNKLFVGREFRIKELKEKLVKLEKKLELKD